VKKFLSWSACPEDVSCRWLRGSAIPQFHLSYRERTTGSHEKTSINKLAADRRTVIRFYGLGGILAERRGWESYLPGSLHAKLAASSVLPCPM
jgi:hypothetical protein